MTTSTPSPRQASVGALFGGRHYAHIAGFLNAAGTHRETIEHIAYILAADNPHFNAEVFGREAGLESARESYTQDELKANLVTAAGITERLGLRSAKRVADWRQRYSDFPEPFLGGRGTAAAQARARPGTSGPRSRRFSNVTNCPSNRAAGSHPALTPAQVAGAKRMA